MAALLADAAGLRTSNGLRKGALGTIGSVSATQKRRGERHEMTSGFVRGARQTPVRQRGGRQAAPVGVRGPVGPPLRSRFGRRAAASGCAGNCEPNQTQA